ncbi:hypothetical protein A6D94_20945 [Vibrio splendidus]|nr:hypothetical protein A6D94_20945 [Vibrio splendidus]
MDYPSNFPWTYKVLNRFLFKISASRSDLLLTVSDYSRKRISHHFGIDSSDIYITPNAVDNIVKFAPEPVTGLVGDDYLLYVSRIEPRKNQHRLAEAFLKANVPRNMKLVFVGAKSLPYAELEPYMNKENIIHLAGVSSGNIAWLYKNAVASIYPSLCEGFGIPPLEASILGCPSYCANNTALSELRPFLNGMFDGEKVEDIVEVIHDSMQAGHSSVDKDSINDKFMWENIAADYRDVLFKRLDTI